MHNYLYLVYLLLVILIMGSCENNLSSLANDESVKSSTEHITKVSLEDLTFNSPDGLWEQFFRERNAIKVWDIVKTKRNYLVFNSIINQQPNEIIEGIVHYLIIHIQTYLRFQSYINIINNKRCKERLYLPADIGRLTNLTILNLSGNNFNNIPVELVKLTNLTVLDLSENNLSDVPPVVCELTSLADLNLSSNKLTRIPFEIGNHTGLYQLNLYSNKLTELPVSIGNLVNLHELDISYNYLTRIPFEIGNFTRLCQLRLRRNKLTELPASIGNLTNLELLSLMSNNIREVPFEVVNLVNLSKLGLSCNNLVSLPINIFNLSNLTDLDLTRNQLQEIPNQLTRLSKLKDLRLSYNKLKDLPEELSRLDSLRILKLPFNQLTKLPILIIFRPLKSTLELELNNNRWLNIRYPGFIKINKEILRKHAYKQFPYSLIILCMECVENHPGLFANEEIENVLPEELRHEQRIKILQQTYKWKLGENIVCFRMIDSMYIPFYLNFRLTKSTDVKLMLGELKEELIFQIVGTDRDLGLDGLV